ncbi:MAG: hypothetical protein DSZ27_08395 [Thiomicrospira sp.]|nr:MAG: hypothetical protein DSZ27_08395 [Thiomicrospira sp.]
MANVIDICNIALSHLGQRPNVTSISPPEGSVEAEYCATYWPLARDAALGEFDWGFATRVSRMNKVISTVSGYEYMYALPSNCIRVSSVIPEDSLEEQEYEITDYDGGRYVISNQDDARIKYVYRLEDPVGYPPAFTDALTWLMASHLSMPVTRDIKLKKASMEMYEMLIQKAKVISANQSHKNDNKAGWIEARS